MLTVNLPTAIKLLLDDILFLAFMLCHTVLLCCMVICHFYALPCCCVWLHSDKGMKHLTNVTDWVDLFDVVVVQARKPKFYFDTYRLV